jgi:hypothetical protein
MKYLVKRISTQTLELLEGQYPNSEIFQDILDAPQELEHPNDCDIVEYEDEMTHEMRKRVVFNAAKREARLLAEAEAKQAAINAVVAEAQKCAAIKADIKSFKVEIKEIKKGDDLIPLIEKIIIRLDEILERVL